MEISAFGYQRATNISLLQVVPGSARRFFSSTEAQIAVANELGESLIADVTSPAREAPRLRSEVTSVLGSPQRQISNRNHAPQPASQGLETRDEPETAALPAQDPVWVVALERNPGRAHEAAELFSHFECYPVEQTLIKLKKAIRQTIHEEHDLNIVQEYEHEFKLYKDNPCKIEAGTETDAAPRPFRHDFMQLLLNARDPIEQRDYEHPYFALLTRRETRHWDRGMRHWQLLLIASQSETRRG